MRHRTLILISVFFGLMLSIACVGFLAQQHGLTLAQDKASKDYQELSSNEDHAAVFPMIVQGTVVTGTVSGTWNISNSPYLAIGALSVEEGQTLTIFPGVEIRFAGQFGLSVEGDLVVNGTADSPVVFTSDQASPKPGDWNGLGLLNSSDMTKLKYVIIEYAVNGLKIVAVDAQGSPTVEHARITDSESDGIQITARAQYTYTHVKPSILNSTISNSGSTGIHISAYGGYSTDIDGFAEPTISDNVIRDNGSYGIRSNAEGGRSHGTFGYARGAISGNVVTGSGSSGILIRGAAGDYACFPSPCLGGVASPDVVDNVITDNGYNGISIVAHKLPGLPSHGKARPVIASNIVAFNKNAGIGRSAYISWEEYSPKILNNTIVGNGGDGITIPPKVGSNHDIYSNLIVSNTAGLNSKSSDIPEVWCNDVWGNGTDFSGFPADYGTLDSINANGDPSDKYYNIMLDPLFTDMAKADYHIKEDSPALDAGCDHEEAPIIDIDGEQRPQGERYDIGADEYYIGTKFEYEVYLPALLNK